jgi:predicted nucleotidyltransferase
MAARTLDEIRAELQVLMPALKKRFKVESLEIFGSYVRGEQTEKSDVDVEFRADKLRIKGVFANLIIIGEAVDKLPGKVKRCCQGYVRYLALCMSSKRAVT